MSLNDSLFKIDWMDEETRSKAREKLENMVPFVAYPDELLDDQKLDCFHESLKVDADISFLEAIRNAVVFNAQNKVKTFNEPIVISDWTQEYGRAAVVNAFYSPHANAISWLILVKCCRIVPNSVIFILILSKFSLDIYKAVLGLCRYDKS